MKITCMKMSNGGRIFRLLIKWMNANGFVWSIRKWMYSAALRRFYVAWWRHSERVIGLDYVAELQLTRFKSRARSVRIRPPPPIGDPGAR